MSKKKNKKEHANKIRKKYLLEDKHISIRHGYHWHNDQKPLIYISEEIPDSNDLHEITAPGSLDKYLGKLKRGEAILYDIDSDQKFTWDDHFQQRMILRIAGIE